MADKIERFFNWQTDMDWAWGPFLPLRPPRESAFQPWVWVRLCLMFTLLGIMLVALLTLLCVLLPQIAARERWALSPPLTETLATLTTMVSDHGFQLSLAGLVLSLPLLFFLACFPFHVAWNRRAARLSQTPKPEPQTAQTDVWPPAPNDF